MDLVKARQRARKKAHDKKKKNFQEEEISACEETSSVLPEENEIKNQETPFKEEKKTTMIDPLDIMVQDEVFSDDSFGEDIPVMDAEQIDEVDHMLSESSSTLGSEIEEDDVGLSWDVGSGKTGDGHIKKDRLANESMIIDFDADEETMSDIMIGEPASEIIQPKQNLGKKEENWSVKEARDDKPAPFRKLDLAEVEVEWDEHTDTELKIDKLGINDDDFYALVSEDLYMREFGHETDEALGPQVKLLSFRLANEVYAVRLSNISQIIKMNPVTMVPRAPGFVLGIISLRGVVIPVFDLRRKLNLPQAEKTRKTRIIVVNSGNYNAGLIVDEVEQVVSFSETGIEPPPSMLGSIESDYIEGIGRIDKKLIIMLELSKILVPIMGD